eukprot:1135677-Amphidinium_carterae.1
MEIVELTNRLKNASGMVPLRDVRRLAGQLAWASSVCEWVKSFNRFLWGAISDHLVEMSASAPSSSKRARPPHLIFVCRFHRALCWVSWALTGTSGMDQLCVLRSILPWLRVPVWAIRTDACPFGLGGILLHHGAPHEWYSCPIPQLDRAMFNAVVGDPAFQSAWELLALLLAVWLWEPKLVKASWVALQSDSMAALLTAKKMAGKDPINL